MQARDMRKGRWPSYARIVVTKRCSLRCTFCHREGTPESTAGRAMSLPCAEAVAGALARLGFRKIKLLGGEPLVMAEVVEVVRCLRRAMPTADLSAISNGAVEPARLRGCVEAGMNRLNVSVHGWSPEALGHNGGKACHYAWRQENLAWIMRRALPLKLNYVVSEDSNFEDLNGLLSWAADKPVVVGVLNDLNQPGFGSEALLALLRELRPGRPVARVEEDVDSLSTRRLSWPDGLEVEVKDQRLGAVAPWRHCDGCPARARCGEGIFAVRVDPDGALRLCMDRPELRSDAWSPGEGAAALAERWGAFIEEARR